MEHLPNADFIHHLANDTGLSEGLRQTVKALGHELSVLGQVSTGQLTHAIDSFGKAFMAEMKSESATPEQLQFYSKAYASLIRLDNARWGDSTTKCADKVWNLASVKQLYSLESHQDIAPRSAMKEARQLAKQEVKMAEQAAVSEQEEAKRAAEAHRGEVVARINPQNIQNGKAWQTATVPTEKGEAQSALKEWTGELKDRFKGYADTVNKIGMSVGYKIDVRGAPWFNEEAMEKKPAARKQSEEDKAFEAELGISSQRDERTEHQKFTDLIHTVRQLQKECHPDKCTECSPEEKAAKTNQYTRLTALAKDLGEIKSKMDVELAYTRELRAASGVVAKAQDQQSTSVASPRMADID